MKAVMIGVGTGLVGGGLVIPLGRVFAAQALSAGDAGYGLLLSALGTGAAAGVVGVIAAQRHLPRELVFCFCVLGAGTILLMTAFLPGVRLTLWSGSLIVLAAGFFAFRAIGGRSHRTVAVASAGRGSP